MEANVLSVSTSTPRNTLNGEDLRKTARGASSPAKPDLHIPELAPALAVRLKIPSRHPISEVLVEEMEVSRKISMTGAMAKGDLPIVDDESCYFI